MYLELKEEIKNIIEVVQQCPEKFQERCFEILLNQYITDYRGEKPEIKQQQIVEESKNIDVGYTEESIQTDEIKQTDFHIKVQKFMSTNGISISDINNLYYKENDKLMPLYETLGSTKMSECQMRIALLTAFENSFSDPNGDMTFNGEVVRQRCQAMKCYDMPNFSTNFKKNSSFIDNFNDKYDKNANYSLSIEGKKELAKIISELAKEI
ncbi:MAG: hypothetical protein J6A03_03225 [Lachnospiraceae bacterium]|nr:hypothetical protein [Lachnospiraceae bacterium]